MTEVSYGPLPMERASLGPGHELAYFRAGETGPPVLLVMGYCVPGRAWRFQWPALAEHFQVALFDNRGVGGTTAPPGPWTMKDLASDALRLLDHLGWDSAHVIGVSMGGMIAQRMALMSPERVNSLSLIATHAGGLRAVLPTVQGARHFLSANLGDQDKRGAKVARLLFPDSFVEEIGFDWVSRVLQDDFTAVPDSRSRRWQLAAVLSHRTARELHRLAHIPTLIIRPDADLLVQPKQSDRLARLMPHARLITLPNAGHGAIRQCAERINAALIDHLRAS